LTSAGYRVTFPIRPSSQGIWPPGFSGRFSFKTELITDRVWHSRSQLELAIVEYISWFNESRLHENLGDRPPSEIEELYALKTRPTITTS
jgi:hypothetical protein